MNKEILDTLDDLSKRPTTELAMRLMETTVDNMAKDKELERYKNIIDEAIDYLRDIRQSTFTKYNSNEWNNCLSFNDDIKPLLDKLKELKGE